MQRQRGDLMRHHADLVETRSGTGSLLYAGTQALEKLRKGRIGPGVRSVRKDVDGLVDSSGGQCTAGG
jgi:hypothetical protein